MGHSAAVRQAYIRLERLTPLPADCGRLCGKRCCKGGDEDGMVLFPGEEDPKGAFAVSDCEILGVPARFAVCKGPCRREARPLSCRIFPFAPYLDGAGKLTAIPDPRAKYICPLLKEDALPLVDPRFIGAVEKSFAQILEAEAARPMLEAYSRVLDEYKRFTG
ncbi:MAG: hypothetical protein FWG28_06925 [Clostridiales bacterium]|nr:hypothetical protein [Clostridiales bacterium]